MIGQWIVNNPLREGYGCCYGWSYSAVRRIELLIVRGRGDTVKKHCVSERLCYNIWSADWGREVPHPEWGDGQEFTYQEELFHLSRNRNFSPKKLEVLFLERLVLMLWKYRQQCDLLRRYLIANAPDQNVGMWTRLWRSNCGRCCTLISNLDCRVCDTVGDHCNGGVDLLRLCCTLCSHIAISV